MRARLYASAALVAALSFAVGCVKTDAPDDPVWGKQPCAQCTMLVGDRLHAAQLVSGGDRHFFDDIGCMAAWMAEHAATESLSWVRDARTGAWVDARAARYATGASTPMDYGFEARADGALGWNEVREQVSARGKQEPRR